jgi:hypothetical protein
MACADSKDSVRRGSWPFWFRCFAMLPTFPTRSHYVRQRILRALCCSAPGIFILLFNISAFCAPALSLATGPGGITIAGNAGSLGNVNGLGVGTLGTGASLITSGVSNGVFYYSPVNVGLTGLTTGATGLVTAYINNDFTHTAVLTGYICSASCSSFGSYTQLPTTAGSATTVAAAAANNSTIEVWVGSYVSNTNGANAFTGADSVRITFTATDSKNGKKGTVVLRVNLTVQNAVELTLSPASGGLGVSLGSDFAMNFQNVNGLGINPAAGLTATSVPGGYVYHTPYAITPVFAGFTTTTTGTLKVQLKTAFGSPTMIFLEDSASSGGPYSAITTTATTITSSAGSNTGVTRYLGLFVSNANGAGTFTGTDSSSLTYTLTVP